MAAEIDPSSFGRVAVLMGGGSAEREISLMSGKNVLNALLEEGVQAEAFDPKEMRVLPDLGISQLKSFDRAFIALHGPGGEDGVIQGVLEHLAIPYTGSGIQASSNCMDKIVTKNIWSSLSIPTPQYWVIEGEASLQACQRAMSGPVMVKPCHEGSSIGMSVAESPEALAEAYRVAYQYDHRVLVESFIKGPEYTVGFLKGEVLPAIQLKAQGVFYDYEAKYESTDTEYLLPSGLSPDEEQALQLLCKRAYQALGCRGWGRVDVMRDQQGKFWLLEVNTIPGMTKKSLVPMAAQSAGHSFNQLVTSILQSATLDRAER